MILIDLQKTCDTVNHEILINKMEFLGFSKDVILWFKSYLSYRKFKVNLNKSFFWTRATFMWSSPRIYFRSTSFSYRRVTRGAQGRRGLPRPFSKIGKKCPNLWQECPDYGHLWVKFSFKMQFLRVSRGKNQGDFFPVGLFFLVL